MTKKEKAEYQKKYQETNREKIKAKHDKWIEANPEYFNKYYQNNSKKISKQRRIIRETNPEKVTDNRKKNKEWRIANPERVKKKSKQWREDNHEKIKITSLLPIKNLTDTYIAGRLKIPVLMLRQYPELLEAKRLQINIKRQIQIPLS